MNVPSAFPDASWTRLRIQTVLYGSDPAAVTRSLRHVERAVARLHQEGWIRHVEVRLGDGSPTPVFSQNASMALQSEFKEAFQLEYIVFGENRGTARGHNSMFEGSSADFLLVMNPDVVMASDCLVELFRPMRNANVGMVEARQIPIEHPKAYHPETGDTSWASTACALIRRSVFRKVGGFDADTFFLYCDDVDFSWRVRLAEKRVVFQPSAVVFHDKRLSRSANWMSTEAERYFSAEAALLLAHKYSRFDLVERIQSDFRQNGAPHFIRALESFEERQKSGRLCAPIDADHRVAEFNSGEYASHRFKL